MTYMGIIDDAIGNYAKARTRSEPELLRRLMEETSKTFGAGMLTGRVEGRFLKMLVQLSGARNVLEIGTYTGYSALSMAEGLPDDGRLITCEIDPEVVEMAKTYFDQSPHGSKIEVKVGPALETIQKLYDENFTPDFVFIDADKVNYPTYYEATVQMLPPGGLIAVDNALWDGAVLEPEDRKASAIARLNSIIAEDSRVENVLLSVRDGIHLVRKL